jgi:lysozyme
MLRSNLDTLIESIKVHEGYSSQPYTCTEGFLTIGYGRNLQSNGITQYEADMMLKNDLYKIDSYLGKRLPLDELPQNVYEVLLEMGYQLGIKGLLGFEKTIDHIENAEYLEASEEMLRSKWAFQTPTRAKKLSKKMAQGVEQCQEDTTEATSKEEAEKLF